MRSKLARIKSTLILVIFTCMLMSNPLTASDWDYTSKVEGDKIKLSIKGKSTTYWTLDKSKPTRIKVSGPTKLKVYSRAVLPGKKKEGVYGIVTLLDGDKRYFIGRGTAYSKRVKNQGKSKQRIGEARSIYFDVPPGEHVYELTLPEDAKNPVFVRFYTKSNQPATTSWIAYLPRNHTEEVHISVKEREYIYYRTTRDEPVELDVIGPTRIRCVARLEFDHTMRGERLFRVQVWENGNVLLTKALTGIISGTATYSAPCESVVSKGENFYIEVPPGKHRLKVNTPDTGISVLFRFYLPEKDLGNVILDTKPGRASTFFGKLKS